MTQLYEYSLIAALSLLLFFAVFFLVAKAPENPIYGTFMRSSRIMGAALLVLSLNYIVHLFVGVRFLSHAAAILLNLSTYFLAYWLFTSAFIVLLDRNYLTKRRLVVNISLWALYFAASVGTFFLGEGMLQNVCIMLLAVILIVYGVRLSMTIIRIYNRTVRLFDDTCSDNIASYIEWMSVLMWWAIIYGVGCGLLTFLPDRYIFIWILSSMAFYIYVFCSYFNYLLHYDRVEKILETSEGDVLPESGTGAEAVPPYYPDIAGKLAEWIPGHGYTTPGLTLEELAETVGTNRTYLSNYIRDTYRVSFREWIAYLRIDYAKAMMEEHPEYTVAAVSESAGFVSLSYFTRIFRKKEGVTPGKWIKTFPAEKSGCAS